MTIIHEPSPLLEGNFLLHYWTSNYIAKSIPFLLLIKNAVNDITVNIRKATKKKKERISFLSSKCFPCRVKHLPRLAECILGTVLGQRDALELEDEALQIKNSKESCNLLPTGIPLCHQFHLSKYLSRHLKKIKLMINTHEIKDTNFNLTLRLVMSVLCGSTFKKSLCGER